MSTKEKACSQIEKIINENDKDKDVKSYLFDKAGELYEILNERSIIGGIKKTPLLGSITIKNKKPYSRYDYIKVQIYIYQFISNNLKGKLKFSLTSKINIKDFTKPVITVNKNDFKEKPTIHDALQLLVFIYNMGHFKNTFAASRAMVNTINSDTTLLDEFINNFEAQKHKEIARNILSSNYYYRFHLLNSLLLLLRNKEENKEENKVVDLSINILTEYLSPENEQSEKFNYIFSLFKSIREITFTTLDLSIAPIPISIDMFDDKHFKILLTEVLSNHNNKEPMVKLFDGLTKLLQDNVYNEESTALVEYNISQQIAREVAINTNIKDALKDDYIKFVRRNLKGIYNIFNKQYTPNKDFDHNHILKISFEYEGLFEESKLMQTLNEMVFIKAAWYFRIKENKVTLLVSIKNNCKAKKQVAFKVMQLILNNLYEWQKEQERSLGGFYHDQIILTVKYFLFYMFGERNVILKGTLDVNTCVMLHRDRNCRLNDINALIKKNKDKKLDDIHEIKSLENILGEDESDDITLIVCSSIKVKKNIEDLKNGEQKNSEIAEFDGMIIFPNREEYQIIFVESKNRKKGAKSKSALKKKFKNLEIKYDEKDIKHFENTCNEEDKKKLGKNCRYNYKVI